MTLQSARLAQPLRLSLTSIEVASNPCPAGLVGLDGACPHASLAECLVNIGVYCLGRTHVGSGTHCRLAPRKHCRLAPRKSLLAGMGRPFRATIVLSKAALSDDR